MKSLNFSSRAIDSLDAISEWTLLTFGVSQAKVYHQNLLQRCYGLAEGIAPYQSCRDVFAPDLRDDLRFSRAGQHYVLFVETTQEVLVVDFIHQRRDVLGKLRDGFGSVGADDGGA